VAGHQHAVEGGVHVGLQVAVAEGHRVLEGDQGVLQAHQVRVPGAAAVREGEHRAGLVEAGVEEREAGARAGHA
jgi:hypothetical protein